MHTAPGSASRFATFIRHLAEMLVAMFVGMAITGVLLAAVLGLAGAPTALDDRPVLALVAMAVEMTLPMAAWMAYRGHRRRDVVEMTAAMLIPAAVLALAALAGPIGPHDAMGIYHPTMLVAMVGLMLVRFGTYSSHAHHPQADHQAEAMHLPVPSRPPASGLRSRAVEQVRRSRSRPEWLWSQSVHGEAGTTTLLRRRIK